MQYAKTKNRASTFKQQQKNFYSNFLQSFYQHLNVGKFHEKRNILTKSWENRAFFQRLCLDQIQNDDQNIDGIDCFHQHIQSSHSPRQRPGSTFHSVMLGSFDLYAV